MSDSKTLVISTSYLGPVSYFAQMVTADNIFIEAEEHYIKQTYRNRCRIMTANGLLNLTIPVIKVHGNHTRIRDIEIDYSENWQKLHWRAIESAYKHSPYFQFYEDALKPFYEIRIEGLLEFNQQLMQVFLKLAGINKSFRFTESYLKNVPVGMTDLRNSFSPKRETGYQFPVYTQVFSERYNFAPDLSVLDLLFNLGPDTPAYLDSVTIT